jgi:DNA modification methylase
MLVDDIDLAIERQPLRAVRGRVDLVFTSPPFPLIRKKKYGNDTGDSYIRWLEGLAPRLAELLAPNGSMVIEIGNGWLKGSPAMSTLPLEAMLAFKKAADLQLCQYLICHNPARLPTPAAWVTIRRERLKDSFTHIWWMARSNATKADNRRVLLPYGSDQKRLLKTRRYNPGKRPSGHTISATGFLADHGGAIAPSVVEGAGGPDSRVPSSLLKFTGTAWDIEYRRYCNALNLTPHPARMQQGLAAFLIQFLTEPGDLVVDPFAGSNTTGAVAETLGRRWISVERNADYAHGSQGRFLGQIPATPASAQTRG